MSPFKGHRGFPEIAAMNRGRLKASTTSRVFGRAAGAYLRYAGTAKNPGPERAPAHFPLDRSGKAFWISRDIFFPTLKETVTLAPAWTCSPVLGLRARLGFLARG